MTPDRDTLAQVIWAELDHGASMHGAYCAADAVIDYWRAHTPPAPTASPDPLREQLIELCAEAADERRYLNGSLVVYADDVRATADPAWRDARLAFEDGDGPDPGDPGAAPDPRPDQGWQEGDRG